MDHERVGIVHERLTEIAGSEHVIEQLALEWPDSEVFTTIARPEGIPAGLTRPPHTTRLDKLYHATGQRTYAPLMPLMPSAFRHLDLSGFDVVIASHHAFATQAVLATDAPVVAYVHSPARWAWDPTLRASEGGGRLGAAVLSVLSRVARRAEVLAAPKLSTVVANSSAVATRIKDWWRRDSVVVPPPVDTEGFTIDPTVEREDFYLLAGRLVPYKRPDIAVLAAAAADVPLVVVGEGRAFELCRSVAGPRTKFLGRVPHAELLDLHRRAKALLMPGVEDFGIVPVEAMATGTPVIALGEGGAVDTVIPGLSGAHVANGTDREVVDGFVTAIRSFRPDDFDRNEIRRWAENFSRENFRRRMHDVVSATV